MFEIIPKLEQRKLEVVTKQILALTNALMYFHEPNSWSQTESFPISQPIKQRGSQPISLREAYQKLILRSMAKW